MIEGLHLDFGSDELSTLVKARIAKRKEDIKLLTTQMEQLKASGTVLDGATTSAAVGIDAFESKIKEYQQKIQKLEIYVAHFIPNETYRILEVDLERLDLVKSRW